MEDDNNHQTSRSQLSAAKVQGQLAGMSQDIKEDMALSIASLVKVMTPMNDSNVVQNDQQRSVDPRTVQGMTDPLRVTEEPGTEPVPTEDGNAGVSLNDENDTYTIEESTQAFLELAFTLKKPADNKTRKTWETKFKSDATRCPKLDTIIEGVVRKDSLDEDRELSYLQNFMLDTAGPLVAAFEELGKDELDPDRISAAIQHALLFLGNASARFSHICCTKIKWFNPKVQSLAKDMNFSQSAPYLFGQGIEQKIKEHVDAVRMLKRTINTEFKPKNFFEGAPLKQVGPGGADIIHKPATNPTTKTKEVSVQEGPSQRQPSRGRGQ